MEARIYAEDANQGFVPSTGRIEQDIFPDRRNVRIDTGVETGDEVSIHYDQMIAKLIVHGDTREQARGALIQARSQSFIAGPTTNLGFLQRLANSDTFADGTIDTNLLDRDPEIVSPKNEISDANFAIAAAAWLHKTDCENTPNPWTQSDGWRIGEHATRKIELQHLDLQKSIEVSGYAGRYQAHLDEQTLAIELQTIDQHAVQLRMNQKSERLHVFSEGNQRLDLVRKGQRQTFSRHEPLEAISQTQSGEGRLIAPMPGKVLTVETKVGAAVKEGDTLIIMEAIKMELAIKAPFNGTVEEIAVSANDMVEADIVLLEIAPNGQQ